MTPFLFPVHIPRGGRKKADGIIDDVKPEDLRKEFDYFCPACLYQTNEFTVLCPKCGHEGLRESGEDRFRKVR